MSTGAGLTPNERATADMSAHRDSLRQPSPYTEVPTIACSSTSPPDFLTSGKMEKPPILSEDELIAAYEEENPTDDHAIGCASVARCQLKRFVEWLYDHTIVPPDGSGGRLIPENNWRELEKLAGGQK